jgi:hypothetical protein
MRSGQHYEKLITNNFFKKKWYEKLKNHDVKLPYKKVGSPIISLDFVNIF